jgi:hypothetical protein
MIKVPFNADIKREIDLIAKGVYEACQAAANGTPLIGFLFLMDEDGNPIKREDVPALM